MIYFNNDKICIRAMVEADIDVFFREFSKQGWEKSKPKSLFEAYYNMQNDRKRAVVVAEKDGRLAGYATLVFEVEKGPYKDKGIPEIVDFNVLKKFQRQGIGHKIMDIIEQIALEKYNAVSLSVGLYADYGTAQRMYVKRGYIPDGSGIWYDGVQIPPGQTCMNDDDLVLYFSKSNPIV